MINITEKIQKLRKAKGWSVARLAREANIPTVSLRAMLSRKDPNRWNVSTLEKLAKALDVSVSYLTMDDENKKPLLTAEQKEELFKKFNEVLNQFFKIEGSTFTEKEKKQQND